MSGFLVSLRLGFIVSPHRISARSLPIKLPTATLTTTLIFSSQPACAAKGKLLLEQLVAQASVEGIKITWGSIREELNNG